MAALSREQVESCANVDTVKKHLPPPGVSSVFFDAGTVAFVILRHLGIHVKGITVIIAEVLIAGHSPTSLMQMTKNETAPRSTLT